MNTFKRFLHLFSSSHALGNAIMKRSLVYKLIDDKLALKLRFRYYIGAKLNIDQPLTFNEKMQWLKLYNRCPQYTIMADKYLAKGYASDIIGKKYIVPTYGVWERAEDIDYNHLPAQFVLKTNHGYGGNTGIVICKDKETLDKKDAAIRLTKSLKRNYFYTGREWPYKNIPPRILAEKYLGENLQDFRVYCFNGEPKMIYSYTNVAQSDGSKPELSSCDIFDCEWNPMPFHQKTLPCGNVKKPQHLQEMLDISAKLSNGVPFLRVDFYEGENLYLGELTFFPGGGMSFFYPAEWDRILGDWLTLPKEKIE